MAVIFVVNIAYITGVDKYSYMMGLAPLVKVNINIKGAMMYEMGANEPTCM